ARIVCTYVAVEPVEHLKGAAVGRIVLRVLGGELGDYAYVCPEEATVTTGERAVLFLGDSKTPRSATGEQSYYLLEGPEGKLPIAEVDGRTVVAVPQGTSALGVPPGDGVSESAVDYAKFRELVHQASERRPGM
ncbi:MAG: hypothetical protein AB1505_37050, partial [Candidatus Latescibacterota bacterium]